MSPADWELWRGAGKVTVLQAVWLAMGLEPVGTHSDDPGINSEFRKRLAIASSWMDELPHDEGASSYIGSWRVNLAQFGYMAISRGWKLPAEFPVSDELPKVQTHHDETGKGAYIHKKSALIAHLEPVMKEQGKLSGLLSNAAKSGLSACRVPGGGGWNLGEVARWLFQNGYLKDDVSKDSIESIISKALNNS